MRLDRMISPHVRVAVFAGSRATNEGTMVDAAGVLVNCRTCRLSAAREFGLPTLCGDSQPGGSWMLARDIATWTAGFWRAAWDVSVAAFHSVRMCHAQNHMEGCVHFGLAGQTKAAAMVVGCWAEWVNRSVGNGSVGNRFVAPVSKGRVK